MYICITVYMVIYIPTLCAHIPTHLRIIHVYVGTYMTAWYMYVHTYMSSFRHHRGASRFSCPYLLVSSAKTGERKKSGEDPPDPKDRVAYARRKQTKGNVPGGL